MAPAPEDLSVGEGGAPAEVQLVGVLGQVDLQLPAVDHTLLADRHRVAACETNQQPCNVVTMLLLKEFREH